MNQVKFILASNSPRRKELIEYLGIDFKIDPSDIDEVIDESMENEDLVMSLAYQKAYDVSKRYDEEYVLGFDTLVILDGKPIGKPNNRDDAFEMLKALSGNKHTVLTGVAIVKGNYKDLFYDHAQVIFNEMTDAEINDYLDTGEPFDKAGAYGIQGYGAKYIRYIKGDYYSVMGMPIQKLYNRIETLK
jgi:septum formation protein